MPDQEGQDTQGFPGSVLGYQEPILRGRSGSKQEALVPEPFLKVWQALTAPWVASDELRPEDRRRAQMLSGLALVFTAGAVVLMFLVPLATSSASVLEDRGLLAAALFVVSGGLAVYGISRTKKYEWAAWLLVFGTMAWVSLGVVSAEGTPWASSAPLYLALTVVLSTVLLPLMATLFVVAVNLALLLALYRFLPAFGVIELSNAMTFLAIASTVLVITALVRYFDIRQIEDQAADIQESQKRYRSLFEASFEGLALHANGVILEANQALAEMYRTTRDALRDTRIVELFPEQSQRWFVKDAVNSAHETIETEGLRRDGTRFPMEFISKPYLFQGQLVQVTGIRDITERKEMERVREKTRELEIANRKLVEMDRLRTRFLNVASHELNTPITPLRMQVYLLKTRGLGDLNDRQLNAVEILDRNLVRLSVLVKDILDVSKIEAGRLRLRKVATDVSQILEDAVDTFDQVATERRVRLLRSIDKSVWSHADSGRVSQVVSNLLSNALKFTPEGGTVSVDAKLRDGLYEVRVEDTGVGLHEEQVVKLFRPFEQAHDLMEMTEGGSGLGLYICKGIVEAHGGQIGIDSKGAGNGVRVWFTLPVCNAGTADAARQVGAGQQEGFRDGPAGSIAEGAASTDSDGDGPLTGRSHASS